MAKQAHQADLQADVVAKNIAARLRGEPGEHGFKTELVCIVDALDSGMLVYRGGERNLALPRMRAFHWLKQRFEARYLTAYRCPARARSRSNRSSPPRLRLSPPSPPRPGNPPRPRCSRGTAAGYAAGSSAERQ